MNSTRLLRVGLLAVSVVGIVGCSNLSTSSRGRVVAAQHHRPVTFALSVTVKGGLQPTPEQWSAIQARISGELLAAGHVLVTDLSIADRIIRVDFRPNPSDPLNSGNAVIVSVRDNPLRQLALVTPPAVSPVRSSPYPSSFGFGQSSFLSSYYSLSDPYDTFGRSYYGFGHSYYDGYTYSSPNLSPSKPVVVPVAPVAPPRHGPGRHHPGLPPGERPVCPPLLAVANPVAPTATRVAYPSDRPTRAFVAAARSVPSESRAYASADRSERAYARSDNNSWFRSVFGGSSSSDTYSNADRYDRYTSQGSVDNSAASARRAESRSVSDRGYARDSSYTRDDSTRSKSDYSGSSYSGSSSYSSSSSSSYASSSSSSVSSSSGSSYSAPAAASSSGGSSGTHDSSSNTQQH